MHILDFPFSSTLCRLVLHFQGEKQKVDARVERKENGLLFSIEYPLWMALAYAIEQVACNEANESIIILACADIELSTTKLEMTLAMHERLQSLLFHRTK